MSRVLDTGNGVFSRAYHPCNGRGRVDDTGNGMSRVHDTYDVMSLPHSP